MSNEQELRKWRLILGGDEADGTGFVLSEEEKQLDHALTVLYDFDKRQRFDYKAEKGKGGRESSSPSVARWLGDIRKYFPQTVVNVMQQDALKHPDLQRKMMLEPEILAQTTPDVHLVATLMELGKLIPSKTKETARKVVSQVVDELMQKLEQRTIAALKGALNRSTRSRNPRYSEIDWHTTIRKNLKHYQPDYKTIIPELRIGYGRKAKRTLKDVVLCIDQSGSMGTSVVYSGIFGAVMASLPQVKTRMVVFDTQVSDLTETLQDPVDLLFGVQLGGGTDINLALNYCQGIINKPNDTILVLITDLYEGGNLEQMKRRTLEIVASGVQMICLLALNDEGSPSYERNLAKFMAENGVPVFACTPDVFPDLMAAAIQKQDITQWAASNEIVLKS